MNKWKRTKDGETVTHRLRKEYSPDWYAFINMIDRKWRVKFGKRYGDGIDVIGYRLTGSWKSLATAKRKAEDAIDFWRNKEKHE